MIFAILDVTNDMVIQPQTRQWCLFPYPGHKKGCPNYNSRHDCPPKVPFVKDVIDLYRKHFFAVVSFDLENHAYLMKLKHSNWTDRQCRCVLYWQNKVKKTLKDMSENFIKKMPGTKYYYCPEAMGVNVFRTCRRHRIGLRKNPRKLVYKVALIGYPK